MTEDLNDLICPHSAAGRPEYFPAKACILAGSTMNCEKRSAPRWNRRLAVDELIERLRSVKWEVTDDGDRMPDDPTHKCVFVDMRPDDFRALLREAAAALEAAREDAARYRWLRDRMVAGDLADETRAKLALRVLGPIAKRPADPDCCGELDAAIDAMLKNSTGDEDES